MTTAVAMLMRFYGMSLDNVMELTIEQFTCLLKESAAIMKMEFGGDDKKETSLTGNQGFALAQTLLPRYKPRGR